jgi:predicted TIM-barrel fold metal-dependent hydrolase
VVFDHYGLHGRSAPDSAAGRRLLKMLALPHVWMKLSGPYRVTDDPLATRPNPAWLAAIVAAAEDRCVWGSDWPHTPPHDTEQGPDVVMPYRNLRYEALVDGFLAALDSPERAERIMVDNPARLYEFPGTSELADNGQR